MGLSVPGINKWLHKYGFCYKQPKGVPHKFDPEKQDNFIQEYETLKAELADDEAIVFMDAVHPTQATKVSCTLAASPFHSLCHSSHFYQGSKP